MKRRDVLNLFSSATGAALLGTHAPGWAQAVQQRATGATDRILVLIELKGGNDGLNMVVPYTDDTYYQLRSSIAIARDSVIRIDSRMGLHPDLQALVPLWEKDELAIVQGVGYPQANLSHFRSIEIWETASRSGEYLADGWVARAMKAGYGRDVHFAAEGVLIGLNDFGPLAGARAVTLYNPEAFVNQARFAMPGHASGNPALQHLLRVENDVSEAAQALRGEKFAFATEFPANGFGSSVRAAAQVVATQRGKAGVPVIVLTLGSFDTHQGQLGIQAGLLRQLGEGLAALRSSLTELGAWDRTLVMTFSEFGRRARQNQSNGTDHGTVAPHFVAGGAVRGGLYGPAPELTRLDGTQNLYYSTDFRQLYATVARDWWGVNPDNVVRGRFEPVGFLRT
ncbi:DUF1501 domain-containing protein [Variovorax terrae]|uniref:DUF1501 domain-containing protein n=1 Tax=Variovorax terrae TaxID=2923278 RepID=A0A9X2AQB6_9BURK|nr:DUF1501 domain-containing protein [Variovorax terrae]MCJ0762996.1 DUF1501 domain-containing protein [Variovorax terrae]